MLSLIQSWADAFKNQPDLQGVYQVYRELRQKGIEFPMTNLDTMAPIHTPHIVSLQGNQINDIFFIIKYLINLYLLFKQFESLNLKYYIL